MKIIAILLMLFGIALIVIFGFMYLLGFAMSFDAPGSDQDMKAWGMRLLIFVPILILVVAFIFALTAFISGNYVRSMRIGLIFPIIGASIWVFLWTTTNNSMYDYQAEMAQDAADAIRYPKQKFLRPVASGTDTIIVFPNGIVAYRVIGPDFPLSGPLGDLNPKRDSIIYNRSLHNDLRIEELDQFIDEKGQKITDVFEIK